MALRVSAWTRLLVVLLFSLVGLTCWGPVSAQEVEITGDLSRPGPVLSPYLYGQFIEHLGRCIHDGIWAEKLRDRKFLLPPGKAWEVVKEGAGSGVVHDKTAPFTGAHCMCLQVGPEGGKAGIRQGGLGLVAGKEYVGHVILAAAGTPGPVEVRLSWGAGKEEGQSVLVEKIGPEYGKFPFRFRAAAATEAASLAVSLAHPGRIRIGCLSLMPTETIKGMRPDTLELIRVLRPPITRWPGGNFVSGYRWKDALGPRDRRPPRWERAWNDVEDNDFGIDEFLVFCREVGTEPYIAVNTGLGSVEDAADEVEYANGAASTHWGAERARNGHAEPYRVTWWGIGNEMYGNWQLGHIPVERYAARHNAFVEAMRARDAAIKVIAVGAPGKWNDVIFPACARHMDLLSGHHYTERKTRLPFAAADARKFEQYFPAYSGRVAAGIRGLVVDFRKRLESKDANAKRVRLAIDEWGIVRDWNSAPDGPGIGAFEHYYCLGDAIAVARAMHEILRAADVTEMANWAQTVNVIGTIKTSRTRAVLDPAGHVLALYRAHLGGNLVPLVVPRDVLVDAVAARDTKRGVVTVGLVHFSPARHLAVKLRLAGLPAPATATAWRINGPELGATNVPGQPAKVTTTVLPEPVPLDRPIELPAHSITVLSVTAR